MHAIRMRFIAGVIGWAMLLVGLPASGQVTWDADNATVSPQDGSGTWNTSGTNWWNGTTNVTWPNLTTSSAIFGAGSGAAGTVTVNGSVTTNGVTFNSPGSGTYSLTSGTISLGGTTPTITANVNASIVSILAGSAGLTKAGAGTLTLSGTNIYSGATTINAGTLLIGNGLALPSAASLAVNSTGVLDLGGYNVATASLTAGASTAKITNSAVGTGTLSISTFNTTVNTLIEDGGATQKLAVVVGGNQSTPSFANANNTFSGGLTISSATGKTRLWNGTVTTTLNEDGSIQSSNLGTGTVTIGTTTAGAQLALLGSTVVYNPIVVNAATYVDGGNAVFAVYGSGNALHGQVTANLSPVSFSNGASSTGSVTLSGRITGPNGLQLKGDTAAASGNVTVTLSNTSANPNNYQGATTVGARHVLSLAAGDQLPNGINAGNVEVNGAIRLNGFTETINGLSGTGTLDGVSGTSTISVGDNNATSTFSGRIANSGANAELGLTKIGSGALTLSGSNNYAGVTQINGGTLLFDTVNGLYGGVTSNWTATRLTTGSGAVAAFTVGSASPQFTAANLDSVLGMTSTGSTGFVPGAAIGINVGSGTTFSYGSTIADSNSNANALGVVKLGAGTLTLSASNSYSGGTQVRSGILAFGDLSAFGSGTVSVAGAATIQSGTGGTLTNAIALGSGAIGTFDSQSNNNTLSGVISGTGAFTKIGSSTLTLNGANTYSGTTTISGGVLSLGPAGTLGNGAVAINASVLDLGNTSLSNVGNVIMTSGTISGAGGMLNAGAVAIGSTSASPSGPTTLSGVTLAASSFVVQGSSTNGIGSGTSTPFMMTSGLLTTTGNLGVGRWAMTIGGSSTVTVSGTIGGTGIASNPEWGTLTIQDNAVVTATRGVNGNAEAWQLNLNGGTLNTPSIQASDRESQGAARLVFNGTKIIATASNAAFVTVGANTGATNSALVGNGGVDIDSSGYDVGIGVNLRPSAGSVGGLTKRGAGALTLSGTNTYAGLTVVTDVDSVLKVNGSVAGNVRIDSTATLGGSGSVGGVLSGAGLVSPGNSPGILTASQFDPTGGLGAAFEFTALVPNYASATESINDVLRLTGSTPFTTALTAGNVIDVYFNVDSIISGSTFEGGFFTGLSAADLLTAVTNATFRYWVKDHAGTTTFNDGTYKSLAGTPGITGVALSTSDVTRSFSGGAISGSVTQFVIVPEPDTAIVAGIGIAMASWLRCKRRHVFCTHKN